MTGAVGGRLPDPNDPESFASFMAQMQHLFATSATTVGGGDDGPVNWDLARRVAAHVAASGGAANPDGSLIQVSRDDAAGTAEALRLADLWLEPTTSLPSALASVAAWSRQEWIDATLPTWQRLCNPVASKVVAALTTVLPEELSQAADAGVPQDLLEQITAPLGGMTAAFARIGGVVFGAQVGHGVGTLCAEVLSATDIGLPLGPAATAALVPQNLIAFSDGLDRPLDEVRLYVALREMAHQRLYGHVPWLRAHVLDTVEAYARGITVDREAFEEAIERIHATADPDDPASMQLVLSDQLFHPPTTPEQQAALVRLETALALVEGWVAFVTDLVAGERLSGAAALSETFRRRRAAGGPAEQTFATLVGLELRPRRLREATTLWTALTERRGADGRDAVWAHPDLMPTAADLDDPVAFAEREPDTELPGLEDL